MSESNSRITWENCSVLLDINDGDRLVFARLSPNASVKIGNKKCPLNSLVGCPFGSFFRVENGANGPFLARCVLDACKQEKDDCRSEDEVRDNRGLIDNNSAQSLSSGDIDAMRCEGATGDEIVDALIANSSTFEKKTAFSQEKYKLKKQKKYAPKVLLRRPFARSICEAYFKKYPNRIGFLRVDTLSLLLSMANVCAYSDVLVVDKVGGILAGAVAERIGGTSYVCNIYFETKPSNLDIARTFNFSNEVCRRIVQVPFSDLSAECNDKSSSELHVKNNDTSVMLKPIPSGDIISEKDQEVNYTCRQQTVVSATGFTSLHPCSSGGVNDTQESKDSMHISETVQGTYGKQTELSAKDSISLHPCSFNGENGTQKSNASSTVKSITPGRKAIQDDIKLWKDKGFSSLIVAAPEMELGTVVQDLLPLLSPSAPFAIYHQYLQPLATCMHELQASKLAIGMQISEPWLREYQVLPSRTHPHMQMSGFGGYILSGTRIATGTCNGN